MSQRPTQSLNSGPHTQPSVLSAAVTAVSVPRAVTPAAAAPTTAGLAEAVATAATAIAAVFPATGSGATLSGRGSGTATTGVATTATAVTTTATGVAATAAAVTTATAARATSATTTAATAGAGFGLVDTQRAAHQLSALQGLDGTVLAVVIRHLHEGEAAFAAGVALQGQRAVRHITEGREQLSNILLLSTEGEISNKNAHGPKGPIRRKSSLLSLNR